MPFWVSLLFWVFMLIMDLLTPLLMIYFGSRFEKNAPKKINSTYGYRTAMSMKNQETWEFAHGYIGRLWRVCGWLALLVSVAVMLLMLGKDITRVSVTGGAICVMQIAIMLSTIIPTEIALKKNFDKNGGRR